MGGSRVTQRSKSSPENALRLFSSQSQDLLRQLCLHPGQLVTRVRVLLPQHDFLQRAAEEGWRHDGVPGMCYLLHGWFPEALRTEKSSAQPWHSQDGAGCPCTLTPRWPPGSTVLTLQPPPPKIRQGSTPQAQEEPRSCCLLAGDRFGDCGLFLQGFRCCDLHTGGGTAVAWQEEGRSPAVPGRGEVSREHAYTSPG